MRDETAATNVEIQRAEWIAPVVTTLDTGRAGGGDIANPDGAINS